MLGAGDVIVDVGASVGTFSIAMALQFLDVRIYAMEPAPQNYRYLVWNIRLNNLTSRVWPLNAALRGPTEANSLNLMYSPTWPISSGYCPKDCEFAEYTAPAMTLP